jgi:pyruvate/2-oxoglutarate dehydrogenase complex dihydrolipoamide dehydrogenase (E3) component
MAKPYDLLIIGAGSTGLTAADFAVQLGARVALVEKDRTGGECTWTGCVPSKTLLKAAKVVHHMRTASRYGLPPIEPEVDLKSVMAHVWSVVTKVHHEESADVLRAKGIDVFLDAARFLDPHTVAAGDATLTARHVLIATGAHPTLPPVDGLEDVDCLTYENIWDLEVLPRHLLVLGAGPIGCEMAQAFRRFGARVTLLSSRDQVLPRDDPAAAQVLARVFEAEGIDVRYTARAERAWRDPNGVHLLANGDELLGDTLFVAAGRRPNVAGLDLEKAGVAYSDAGIRVDGHLRTSQKHITAAGDCIGRYQFTHYAGWQAVIAARNALLPGASGGIPEQIPWTTFTDPEVAHAGLTESQARDLFGDDATSSTHVGAGRERPRVMTYEWPMARVDRARADGNTEGFIKLVHKRDGTLLGATIVAERAGEMIHEWILALDRGLKVSDLSNAIHVYPTYSTANWQMAAEFRITQLLSGTSGQILRGLARLVR